MNEMSGTGLAIDARGLVKSYGETKVVEGIDLSVATGEIVAFLGPNGAGKTTTIEILEGFRERDAGDVTVLGEDPATAPLAWRETIGIVLQESEPTPELTALESLQAQAGYYQRSLEPGEVLDLVGLADSADTRTRKLSGGQKRRLDLGMALVGDPDLIFLDEPTTGFDPSARRESWTMIENLRNLGKTVLLTTHYMDEAEHLADRIAVISAGMIVAEGTAQDLADQVRAPTTVSWQPEPGEPPPPSELGAVRSIGGHADRLTLEGDDMLQRLYLLTGWALEHNVELPGLEIKRPTLEDVYLELVSAPETGAVGGREAQPEDVIR